MPVFRNTTDIHRVQTLSRAAANLPQTTTAAIFSIVAPNMLEAAIELISITGIVATTIQTQANNTKLEHSQSGDLCANLDITGDAQGEQYFITGTTTDAMLDNATGGLAKQMTQPLNLFMGDIELTCAASNTGTVGWQIVYRILQPGTTVVAA